MTLNLINNIEIKTVMDLNKIKKLMDTNIIENINYSELGRELNTIKKWIYIDENKPIKTTRNKPTQFDEYKNLIMKLLDSKIKRFYKKIFI